MSNSASMIAFLTLTIADIYVWTGNIIAAAQFVS